MSVEEYLDGELSKFSIIDYALVKWVYIASGLLIVALYPKLMLLDWGFYLAFTLLSAMPLYLHLFSQSGSLVQKMRQCLKTNTLSNQCLLFFSCFFFACMMAVFFPVLASFAWWYYAIAIVILAIKPLTVTWFW